MIEVPHDDVEEVIGRVGVIIWKELNCGGVESKRKLGNSSLASIGSD